MGCTVGGSRDGLPLESEGSRAGVARTCRACRTRCALRQFSVMLERVVRIMSGKDGKSTREKQDEEDNGE